MVPSPSGTLLSNQRLMVLCPYLCTGNPHILTSIYSGTATITSQPSLVLSKPSPIGPPQCAATLSCSKKKRITSGRLSPSVNILNEALDKVEKRLNRSSRQVNSGDNTNAQSANHEVQNKGHIVIPYTQGLCERVAEPSKTYWSPPRTKTLWSTKVVPSTGTNVGT